MDLGKDLFFEGHEGPVVKVVGRGHDQHTVHHVHAPSGQLAPILAQGLIEVHHILRNKPDLFCFSDLEMQLGKGVCQGVPQRGVGGHVAKVDAELHQGLGHGRGDARDDATAAHEPGGLGDLDQMVGHGRSSRSRSRSAWTRRGPGALSLRNNE